MSSLLLQRGAVVAWDAFAWVLAFALTMLMRYDFVLSPEQWVLTLSYVVASIVVQAVLGFLLHLYLGRNRIGSFEEATFLTALVGGQSVALGLAFLLVPGFPRGIAIIIPLLALLFMGAGRWGVRSVLATRTRAHRVGGTPALVYGAGEVGMQVAGLIDREQEPPYRIVGFLDDDSTKRFLRIRGYRVLGTGDQVAGLAGEHGVEVVILAATTIPQKQVREIADACRKAGLRLVVVPPLRELVNGQVSLGQLRELNVTDLLGRRPIKTDLRGISDYVAGRVVLVTGAGGSIGSELARQVKRLGPSKLLLLDRDESALHAVQLSLYGNGLLDDDSLILNSIRDLEALELVFEHHRPEVVFHAAALKHLPMLERFPEEGWKTNVLGTMNVLHAARKVGVQHFVNISTDKAADATSVLGHTKRMAERMTAWHAEQSGLSYLSVRFGNVLGSRGSVLHAFKAQIERGGPVTVTDPDVTRFFMTIPEACELVLQAGAIGEPGSVLVLDMGEPVKILDVARRLIEESGKDIEIEFTGLRPGEKMDEVLFSDEERGEPSSHPLISHVLVPPLAPHAVSDGVGATSGARATS